MDIKQTYRQAKLWAEDKAAQAMPGGGVLTAGVVIIALLIVGFVGISWSSKIIL